MKNLVLIYLSVFILYGCKTYVQVFDTASPNVKVEKDFFVLENDSLKITYSFWTQKGLMTFAIFNKLDKPLYVDWKKSSYIDNSVKLNYWVDEEKNKSLEYYGSYYYDGPLIKPGYAVSRTGGASLSSSVKVERITFIPPKSNYYRSQFYIFPKAFFQLETNTPSRVVPRNDDPRKDTRIYQKTYSIESSPLIFRNFLTFSFNEDFRNEFYIDNEFYISAISEMDRRHFEYVKKDESAKTGTHYLKDENGNMLKFSKYKSAQSFYLHIPNEKSIDYRKRNIQQNSNWQEY